MLLDDFLYLIEKKKFNFIYSIIVPILTTSAERAQPRALVPLCLHRGYFYQLNEI